MKQYKARGKITQKMTRDGAIEVNETKGTKKRISKRAREAVLQKTPEQQAAQDAQAAQPIPGSPAPDISPNAPPLPHAPGTEAAQDTGTAERVLEHIDGAHTRRASKKAARKAQAEAESRAHTSRLQFTEEERAKCQKVADAFAELYEMEKIVVLDAGRYGFVELKYYKPPHGFEEDATFTDGRALFDALWQEWFDTTLYLTAKKMQLDNIIYEEVFNCLSKEK